MIGRSRPPRRRRGEGHRRCDLLPRPRAAADAAREAAALAGRRPGGSCASTPSARRALPGVRAVVTAADAPRRFGHVHQGPAAVRRRASCATSASRSRPSRRTRSTPPRAALAAIELEIEPLARASPRSTPRSPTARRSCTRSGGRTRVPSRAIATATACGRPSWSAATSRRRSRATTSSCSRTSSACRASTRATSSRAARSRSFETGRYLVHTSTQFPALVRDRTAEALGVRSSRGPDRRRHGRRRLRRQARRRRPSPTPRCSRASRRRPVKLVYTRSEEFVAGTMRENAVVKLRSAVTRDGDVVGQEAEWLMDAGAYAARRRRSPAIAMLTVAGAYRVGAVRYRGHAVYTNTPPTGSFRGVCGPYMVFAAERHMDRIAAELGIDRRELRMRNVYRPGDRMPNGQVLHDTAFAEAFERIEAGRALGRGERSARPYHGVGIAAVTWLTNPLAGSATLKLNEDGTIGLITAATDIGSGAVSIGLVQIVADGARRRPEDVAAARARHGRRALRRRRAGQPHGLQRRQRDRARRRRGAPPDLRARRGPDRGGRGGPRGSWTATSRWPARRSAGIPLADVAAAALGEGGPIAATGSAVRRRRRSTTTTMRGALFPPLQRAHVPRAPGRGRGGPATRAGSTILRYVVAQDVGRAINPNGIEGQIHGGVAQGIGYALYENIRIEDGRDPRVRPRELPPARARSTSRAIEIDPARAPRSGRPARCQGRGRAADRPGRGRDRQRGQRRRSATRFDRLPITPVRRARGAARRTGRGGLSTV